MTDVLLWRETLHLVPLLIINGCVLSEESCIVGPPLGVEYERKKQRLQHELCMDYRCYMAQVIVSAELGGQLRFSGSFMVAVLH